MIAKLDVLMREITHRLNPRPAGRQMTEQTPRISHQPLGFAIPAAEQINECVVRQLLNGMLLGIRKFRLRLAAVLDQSVCCDASFAGGRHDSGTGIAENIDISLDARGAVA